MQIAGWVLLLPWVLTTLIWGASRALWLRLLLIAVIAVATMSAFSARRAGRSWRNLRPS